MSRERIRPRPRAGSLADQVLALASVEVDEHGRPLGATSSAELRAWVEDLAEVVREHGSLQAQADADQAIYHLKRDLDEAVASVHAAHQIEDGLRNKLRIMLERAAATEAQLVDLLALELLVVQAYQRAGVLPPGEPPSTAELVARMREAT